MDKIIRQEEGTGESKLETVVRLLANRGEVAELEKTLPIVGTMDQRQKDKSSLF